MPVTQNKPCPYAPSSSILETVTRYRSRGLTTPVDADVLVRAGISESLVPRTLQALQTLDLIDKDGAPTQTLDGLQRAPEAEYRDRLADWLRGAYAEVFKFVDPLQDDATKIRDAFRGYQPTGQRDRMVSLFMALCVAAGLIPEKTAKTAAARPISARPRPQATTIKRAVTKTSRHNSGPGIPAGIPAPLVGLLASLPKEGEGWTTDRRDKFLAAFETLLDFCFPVVPDAPEESEEAA